MKKDVVIRIVSYCLALSLVLCGIIVKQIEKENTYKIRLSSVYKESFYSLCSAINDITDSIEKMLYTNSASQMLTLATELTSKAQTAKAELAQLYNSGELTAINKFLSQVGNYSMFLYRNMILEEQTAETQKNDLESLYKTSQNIGSLLNEAVMNYGDSNDFFDSLEVFSDNSEVFGAEESIYMAEESVTDYPELIYDGPYSDHYTEKTPSVLEEAKEISEDKGLMIAESTSEEYGTLSLTQKSDSKIPIYVYTSENTTVAVSVCGGYTVYMRKYREITTENLKAGQAIEFADKFLMRLGFSNMVQTYLYKSDGVFTVSYAYLDGETVCYPDLIKVGVAVDTGEIMLLETAGYLFNHKQRALPTPLYTIEEAALKVSDNLQIISSSSVLIPKNQSQIRCFEFYCEGIDNRKILMYINTDTLDEEQIFLVKEDENGTLVK